MYKTKAGELNLKEYMSTSDVDDIAYAGDGEPQKEQADPETTDTNGGLGIDTVQVTHHKKTYLKSIAIVGGIVCLLLIFRRNS